MVRSGLISKSGLAPGGNRSRTSNRGFTFTTAVGVVVGVHNRTADGRSPAHVALSAGLADFHVLVVHVAYLADGGHAVYGNVSQLAGRQSQKSHVVFLGHQLSHVAGGPGQLGALAGIQLNVVNEGTGGDIGQRQSVAGLDIRRGAGDYRVADLQAVGGDDISFLAVLILDQGDESGTVRIVFQGLDRSRYVKLLTLEIDDAVFSTVWRTVILP